MNDSPVQYERAVRRSTHRSGRTRLRPVHSALLSITGVLLLAGCGRSGDNNGAKADVIVTFDAKRHNCLVALPTEPHGSAVSCGDIAPFMRDELRLPSGSIYEIRAASEIDDAEIAKVEASLTDAGYKSIGGSPRAH